MRVIAKNTLVDFYTAHPETKAPLERWHLLIKAGDWSSPAEVQRAFANAVVLNGERIKFEVAGGNYRLICAFNFRARIAYVKFLGTHQEYDRVDALTVSQF
jgi:mRNA interferase HigB